MSSLIVAGKRVALDPAATLGKGGEADVYRIDPTTALKVFKGPDHPDIVSDPDRARLATEATRRIAEHQRKLPAFPAGLPDRVIAPKDLAMDDRGLIAGYTMSLVPNARELLQVHRDKELRNKITGGSLLKLFLRLHALVDGIHKAGVVIGDFNDLNVLVRGADTDDPDPYEIDADSMQFGPFLCPMFTSRFVDPTLCDQKERSPILVRPHNANSDWFAFLTMFFQAFLWVGPYGGVHSPKGGGKEVPIDARSLKRLSVLGTDIIYPKPARPTHILPDDVLDYCLRVFEKDHREPVPRKLLEGMRWTSCADCGYEHARGSCPKCGVAAPAVNQVVTIRGSVTATRVFPTARVRGTILQVAHQGGALRILYQENGQMKREDGTVAMAAPARSEMRFRLSGARTMIGMGSRVVVIEPGAQPMQLNVDEFGHRPMFDTNDAHLFRASSGQLVREGAFGFATDELIGSILQGQTTIWTGPEFGFGFYRAGLIFQAFLFREGRRSLNDQVTLPPIPGQLVDAFAVFSSQRCWFFTTSQHQGKLLNRCVVIKSDGSLVATHETTAGDGTWLSDIRGGCAVTLPGAAGGQVHGLFVPTDRGIVRVDADPTGLAETRRFADTEPFVDSSSRLFLAKEGIYVVRSSEIYLITMK